MLKNESKRRRASARPPKPKSKRDKEKFMAFAGVWSDIDDEALIERIMKWRHESPPSDPPGE